MKKREVKLPEMSLPDIKVSEQRMMDLYKKAVEAQNPKRLSSALRRNLIPQIILQVALVVLTTFFSYLLMTWIVVDGFHITDTYRSAMLEALGTVVLTMILLIGMNTMTYRRRLKEITTLSDAIVQVSSGDFDYRIPVKKKEAMTDIYEDFNKMTAELSGVQTLQNDFINSFSHEFKTPIASINGFAELLLEKQVSPEEQRQYLEIIRDESERLSSLTRNTILLSRLSNQQMITDAERYDLGAQLRQCAIICSQQWTEKNQEFTGDMEDGVTYVGNKELMTHVWLNLLGNAIKYTPDGGSISMTMQKQGNRAIVRVKDNGIGMSPETVKHLYDPYYQGDASHSDQGLGLGMSIVKQILNLCHGEIFVDSEPGKGTTITVTLPLT